MYYGTGILLSSKHSAPDERIYFNPHVRANDPNLIQTLPHSNKMSDEGLETYIFRGNEGETVPKHLRILALQQGVRNLPSDLCYGYTSLREVLWSHGFVEIGAAAFCWCTHLSAIKICSTMRCIGEKAFMWCELLTIVEFDMATSSPQELATIGGEAFSHCNSLARIKLPSSVTSVGDFAFVSCASLVEVNLSTTGIKEIAENTFCRCSSMQTATLPNTLRRICREAFYCCLKLVTVVVPLDSQSISIESSAFGRCGHLANVWFPKNSTAKKTSFVRCDLLEERYGKDSSGIVAALSARFEDLPIHRMCYCHSTTTAQELRQVVSDRQDMEFPLVDNDTFGMNPFHILFSTAEPSMELLDVLLESFSFQLLKEKDANGKRPLNYLIENLTDGSRRLLQRILQHWMIDRLANWGAVSWMQVMQSKLQEILAEEDKSRILSLCDEAIALFEHWETKESLSILEMTLWKGKRKSGWTRDGTKRRALDQDECRFLSGSNIVIPSVATMLGTAGFVSSATNS